MSEINYEEKMEKRKELCKATMTDLTKRKGVIGDHQLVCLCVCMCSHECFRVFCFWPGPRKTATSTKFFLSTFLILHLPKGEKILPYSPLKWSLYFCWGLQLCTD